MMENRVIKFRVWDCLNKEWCNFPVSWPVTMPFKSKDLKFSQFTGLFDSKGNEIWEGDIIEINYYKINIPWWKDLKDKFEIDEKAEKERNEYRTMLLPIVFDDGQFVAKNDWVSFDAQELRFKGRMKTGRTHWCDTEEKSWGYVVVGNIYENPELISDGRD